MKENVKIEISDLEKQANILKRGMNTQYGFIYLALVKITYFESMDFPEI